MRASVFNPLSKYWIQIVWLGTETQTHLILSMNRVKMLEMLPMTPLLPLPLYWPNWPERKMWVKFTLKTNGSLKKEAMWFTRRMAWMVWRGYVAVVAMALATAPMTKISTEEIWSRTQRLMNLTSRLANDNVPRLLRIFINASDHHEGSVSAHLPPSFSRLPLHGLVYHELHSRVEYEYEGGEHAVPQCSHSLIGYDLREGVWGWQHQKPLVQEGQTTLLSAGCALKAFVWLHRYSFPHWRPYVSFIHLFNVFIPEVAVEKWTNQISLCSGSPEGPRFWTWPLAA